MTAPPVVSRLRGAGRIARALAVVLALTACAGPAFKVPGKSAAPDLVTNAGLPAPAPSNIPGQFFVEPDDGVQLVVDAIAHARRSIDMTMYLLTYQTVTAALQASVQRGVHVRALLEPHPVGGGPGNQGIADTLTADGVAVHWANPAFRLTHEKSLVLDGTAVLIMTANLTYSAFSSNREYGVLDTDPADAAAVEAIFEADWTRSTVTPGRADLVVAPVNARQKLTALIDGARRSLLAEQEEMEDPGIEAALTAAAKRGVQVQVILPAPRAGGDASAAGIDRIAAAGVAVRRLAAPYPHAKMFLADDRTLYVGSANVSSSSLDHTRELGVIMGNAEAIQRVKQVFARDWSAGA